MPPPKPLPAHPSSEPYEARSNAQLAQIKELTQQCEDLRQQNAAALQRLHTAEETLRSRQEAATQTMKDVQEEWKSERKQWREGCDNLQRVHRLAHYETKRAMLDTEAKVLDAREAVREEQISVLAREFKLSLFRIKEREILGQVAELQVCRNDIWVEMRADDSANFFDSDGLMRRAKNPASRPCNTCDRWRSCKISARCFRQS